MGMMVIYLMDNDNGKIEISAEQFGSDGNSSKLAGDVLLELSNLENVAFVHKRWGSISSPPETTSLN